jgi:hypothetical protein
MAGIGIRKPVIYDSPPAHPANQTLSQRLEAKQTTEYEPHAQE